MIKDELHSAIANQLSQLTKKQLSEILLLVNAWANDIPLANLRMQPRTVQELYEQLEKEQSVNTELVREIEALTKKVTEYEEYSQNLSESLRQVIKENRWLKSDLYLQPKEGQK
ncbi:hypothetical protein [Chroococcidiopsis sp.]|uniref:hypothetical protein n=1 Tax=Chroococcidiopsis sp. TaxID=3088168 RepID=UPI003F2E265B